MDTSKLLEELLAVREDTIKKIAEASDMVTWLGSIKCKQVIEVDPILTAIDTGRALMIDLVGVLVVTEKRIAARRAYDHGRSET